MQHAKSISFLSDRSPPNRRVAKSRDRSKPSRHVIGPFYVALLSTSFDGHARRLKEFLSKSAAGE